VHECIQTKERIVGQSLGGAGTYAPYYYGEFSGSGIIPGLDGTTGNRINATVSISLTDSEKQQLLNELSGDIPPDVRLPNFIIELPEALTLHKALSQPLMGLFRNKGVRARWKAGANLTLAE